MLNAIFEPVGMAMRSFYVVYMDTEDKIYHRGIQLIAAPDLQVAEEIKSLDVFKKYRICLIVELKGDFTLQVLQVMIESDLMDGVPYRYIYIDEELLEKGE